MSRDRLVFRWVRVWKVRTAAWAGVAAGLVAVPLAWWTLSGESSAPRSREPAVARNVRSTGTPNRGAWAELDRTSTDGLIAAAVSTASDPRARVAAVARLGAAREQAAVRALAELARDEAPHVRLAALNALWAGGERALVERLAAESADPAVKSKALALARAR